MEIERFVQRSIIIMFEVHVACVGFVLKTEIHSHCLCKMIQLNRVVQ